MPNDPSSPSGAPLPGDEPTVRADAPHGAQPGDAPTTQMPRPDGASPRRLLRSRDDRVLTGVCAGVGKYFNIDPLIVRIAIVAVTFVGGAGLVAYLAAALLVPVDDGTGNPAPGSPSRAGTIAGAVLIVLLGVAVLDGGVGVGLHAGWAALPFGIVLVLFAAAAVRLTQRGEGDGAPDQPPLVRILRVAAILVVGLIACGLLAVGAAWATAAGGGTVVAAVVIAMGVAMVVLALQRRSAAWLALPALAIGVPAAVISVADVDLDGGVGNRSYAPATVTDLRADGYELGIGEVVVDLRRMEWPKDQPVALKVRAGIGHALVLVPQDVCVEADTRAGAGYVDVLGDDFGGADVQDRIGTTARFTGPRLVIDGDVGLGALEIRHRRPTSDRWHDGPGANRDFGSDQDPIAPALARAGCAGKVA